MRDVEFRGSRLCAPMFNRLTQARPKIQHLSFKSGNGITGFNAMFLNSTIETSISGLPKS